MSRNNFRYAAVGLAFTGLTACGGSKKAVKDDTWQKVGSTTGWYSKTNILDAGKRSVELYSSAALFQKKNPGAAKAYRFRFNAEMLTDVMKETLSGTPTAADTPMAVQTPYYFVNSNNKNVLGIWAVDKFRIYLVESFAGVPSTGNYQINLRQLQ